MVNSTADDDDDPLEEDGQTVNVSPFKVRRPNADKFLTHLAVGPSTRVARAGTDSLPQLSYL